MTKNSPATIDLSLAEEGRIFRERQSALNPDWEARVDDRLKVVIIKSYPKTRARSGVEWRSLLAVLIAFPRPQSSCKETK